MFSISEHSYSALGEEAAHNFVQMLSRDLYGRYPERFFQFTAEHLRNYVESRIAYAARFGITREDCIALVAHVECQCMADFVSHHDHGWWAEILEDDMPQDHKARTLDNLINHIEVHPGFVPVFD